MRPLPKRPGANAAIPLPEEVAVLHPMDVKAAPKKSRKRNVLLASTIVLLLAAGAAGAVTFASPITPSLDASRIQMGAVLSEPFAETVPINGVIIPDETVYLDTVNGGRVVEVFVEDGARVLAGQPLLRLTNTDLELQVMAREAQYTQQLSNLARTQIEFDQTRLGYDRQLSDAQLDIDLTQSALDRRLPVEKTGVPLAEIERLKAELDHKQRTHAMLVEARERDQIHAARNLDQLRNSVGRMQESLDLMRTSLTNLAVTAPLDGQVANLTPRMGEVVAPGARIGQVDKADGFRVKALVDEFYLGRIGAGQQAQAMFAGEPVTLEVSKVYPSVEDRRFRVDLKIISEAPKGLRSGQSLRAKLAIEASEPALSIPTGDFVEHTGGLSVFVVLNGDEYARRRDIQIGRRGTDRVEVLSGLAEGETILISGYAALGDASRVKLEGRF